MNRGGRYREKRSKFLSRIQRTITRLRHRHGHGVHSPYIYSITRNVFMSHDSLDSEDGIYRDLLSATVDQKWALELGRLSRHCGYKSCGIDCEGDFDVIFCTVACDVSQVRDIVAYGSSRGITVAVLSPYYSPEREELCESVVKNHRSTTLDRRKYLLIFNNHLPKQHFQL